MASGKRDFDKAAATWDENPARVKLADDVCAAICCEVSLSAAMKVMDFGCGTGLLTLRMAPQVGSVTGVDRSQGMLDVLGAKVAALGLGNVETLRVDPDDGAILTGRYDLIVSCMALHHVERIAPLLEQFYDCLVPGGPLCIADLDPDEGQFHGDSAGVFHAGFERAVLRQALTDAGFRDVSDVTATEVTKPAANGELRRFTIFLITGRRE